MKTIVTHIAPDLDAITSVWLVHRFLPGWHNAEFKFVPAGQTLNDEDPDKNPYIIHVDTGMGQFDHHQTALRTCAAEKIFLHLKKNRFVSINDLKTLKRIVDVVVSIDHFEEVFLPNPTDDIYEFSLYPLIDGGLRYKIHNDEEVVKMVEILLDGLFINIKNKIIAEKIIEKAEKFTSMWGKTIICESESDDVMKLSFKLGYDMMIRKSKQQGYVRIKVHPKIKKPLKSLYATLKKQDPQATWFYHKSGRMLLNGSSKKPGSKTTVLSLKQVADIVKDMEK